MNSRIGKVKRERGGLRAGGDKPTWMVARRQPIFYEGALRALILKHPTFNDNKNDRAKLL